MGKGKRKKRNKRGKEQIARQTIGAGKNTCISIGIDRLFGVRLDIVICLALALITLAVYSQVTTHEFINFDDDTYVTNNHHVQQGLTRENISWSFNFKDKNKVYWHPLTWLSHMLDCQLYGINPGMHHLTNVFFHVASCVLLFLVFYRMTGAIWKSAFVAALFGLHPLNVDSVAWVSERKNMLSTFFWMLTMLGYAVYCERPCLKRYLLICLCFVMGLMAKPMLITLPFVLLLLDYWPLGRFRRPAIRFAIRLVIEKIPLLIISAGSTWLSVLSLKGYHNTISFARVPLTLRIENALVSYVSYIGKMVWPHNLAIFYPYPSEIPFWKALCSGLFLVLVSLLVVLAAKRRSYLAVGWFWFLGTFVPVTGLIQAGLWPAMADRWGYIPLIGLFVMIAWGVPELPISRRLKQAGFAVIGAVVLLLLTGATVLQLGYWKNSITLWEHALQVTTDNPEAQNNLGDALIKQGRMAEAIRHYSEAVRIDPDFTLAHHNLGDALVKQGRINEAIRHYEKALEINPEDMKVHYNFGIALAREGRTNEAVSQYEKALEINPLSVEVHNNLGLVLARQGKVNEAIRHYSEALRINPNFSEAHNNLGLILGKQGRINEAIKHFTEAVRLNPNYDHAHNNLGIAFLKQGKIDAAKREFTKAVRINPNNVKARNNLRAVLKMQGKMSEGH